jgi:hypothetical protein
MVPVTAIPIAAPVTTASIWSRSWGDRAPSSVTTSVLPKAPSQVAGTPGGTTTRAAPESAPATASAIPPASTRSTTAR